MNRCPDFSRAVQNVRRGAIGGLFCSLMHSSGTLGGYGRSGFAQERTLHVCPMRRRAHARAFPLTALSCRSQQQKLQVSFAMDRDFPGPRHDDGGKDSPGFTRSVLIPK